MKIKIFFIAVMLIWIIQRANAQPSQNDINNKNKIEKDGQQGNYSKEIKKGDKTFKLKGLALIEALKHYLLAYSYDSLNPLLNYKIGYCYLNTIKKVKSIPYLEKAYEVNPNVNQDIDYLLGLAYQLNSEWDKAISEFGKYKLSLSPELKKDMSVDVAKHIEECGNGKLLMQHPDSVYIKNMGPIVNSKFPEYGPYLTADESTLYFTARKDNTTGGGIDKKDGEYFEDVYVAEKENGIWGVPKNLEPPVNSNSHDAVSGLSVDGQRLFIYRGYIHGGDLFESKLNGIEWTKPVSLGKNINTKYHETSACLSSDQKTLYFVSDRPDMSYGGSDIYLSHLDSSGNWGPPENLGPVINTQYDEDGIFLAADDRTLFFSSKGHETMGGYDIFWSKYNDNTHAWSKPVNLGYPINTPDDDLYFVLSANGKRGYYSSIKNNWDGDKDIYMITFLGKGKATADSLNYANIINPVTLFKGRVLDAKTLLPLQASIEIVDNVNTLAITTLQSNSKTGKFQVVLPYKKNYGIYLSASESGYLYHSENINIPDMKVYQEITVDILLNKIEPGGKIVLKNIFYDFDKATLRPESTYELKKMTMLMNEYPTMKICIGSYTDSIGTNEYNQVLSNARAKSVVDWLTTNGIDVNRLVYKGYGKMDPAASNETSEGRQLNRRTEFCILSK